jgi:hypothetical protein
VEALAKRFNQLARQLSAQYVTAREKSNPPPEMRISHLFFLSKIKKYDKIVCNYGKKE